MRILKSPTISTNSILFFLSDIGVDDESGSAGSVVFQVWADGAKLYDSGVMTGNSATKKVNVSVSGKSQIKLIVTDAGDGKNSDHADWANARFIPAGVTPPPPSVKFSIGDRVSVTTSYLSVRATPSLSGFLLGYQSYGKLGTVIDGPVSASGYNWWKINYDSGADGWSVENYLVKK